MCLLAYLLSATPLLPVITALVAWVDGEHRVSLSADKDSTRIVLSHDARDPRMALTHAHCAVSRALMLLAESSGPVDSDHILNFQSASSTTLREATPSAAVPIADKILVPPAPADAVVLTRLLTNVEAPLLDIPPPATSVVVARATVLLI